MTGQLCFHNMKSNKRLYGAGIIVAYLVIGNISNMVLHHVGSIAHPLQTLFLKSLGALIVLSCVMPRYVPKLWHSKIKKWHLLKALAGIVGNVFLIMSLKYLKMAEYSALSLCSTFFMAVGGIVLYKEKSLPEIWIAIGLGMVGAWLMIRPDMHAISWVHWYPILSAAGFSASVLMVKKIGKQDSWQVMLLYLMGFMSLLTLPAAWWFWVDLPGAVLFQFIGIGALYAVAHLLLIKAYSIADASFLAPLKLLKFPIHLITGMMFFAEYFDFLSIIGVAAIVVAAGIVLCKK